MIYETETGITLRVPSPEEDPADFMSATGDAFLDYDRICRRLVDLLESHSIDCTDEFAEKIAKEVLGMAPENLAFLSAYYDTFLQTVDTSEGLPEPAVQ